MKKDTEATRYFSDRQEKRIANALGWDVVSGSGNQDFHPGDLIGPNWLGECKTHVTSGQKIKFDLKVWQKICAEAESKFRYPALIVDDGTQVNSHAWVMFPIDAVGHRDMEEIPWTLIVKTNVVFNGDERKRSYLEVKEGFHLDDKHVVYRVPFNRTSVGVCPFDTFCAMFGEYR